MKWSARGHFWETCVQEHFFFVLRTAVYACVPPWVSWASRPCWWRLCVPTPDGLGCVAGWGVAQAGGLPMPCSRCIGSAGAGGDGLSRQGVALAAVLCHSGLAKDCGQPLLRERDLAYDTMILPLPKPSDPGLPRVSSTFPGLGPGRGRVPHDAPWTVHSRHQ